MRPNSRRCMCWLIAAASVFLALASPVLAIGEFADIYLYDGRHFFGKVVEESASKIVLEIHHGSIVMPMTFNVNEVEKIDRQEPEPAKSNDEGAAPGEGDDDNAPDLAPAAGSGGWAIVPVEGVVGEELTAGFFNAAAKEAQRAGAEVIIFHLDSPGGMVRELEAIYDALDDIQKDTRVAFFVDEQAFSAAALLCMSSKEFYVGEGARVGAAVAFKWGTGAAEVDAKFNAAFAATWRARAEQVGRNPALIDAMVEMKKELWADTSTEPWTIYGDDPHKGHSRPHGRHAPSKDDRGESAEDGSEEEDTIVLLDADDTVLALTHSQAVNVGAADGLVRGPADVVRKLDLDSPNREAFDGERFSDRYFRQYRNNMETTQRAVRDFVEAASMLQGADTRAELKGRLREILSDLNKVITLYDRYDYVRNYIDAQGYSIEQFVEVTRVIRRALGRG